MNPVEASWNRARLELGDGEGAEWESVTWGSFTLFRIKTQEMSMAADGHAESCGLSSNLNLVYDHEIVLALLDWLDPHVYFHGIHLGDGEAWL